MKYTFVSILTGEETVFESLSDEKAVSYCEYLLKLFNEDEGILVDSSDMIIEVW